MLRFEHVSFARGQLPVLRDLSFSISAGERVAIVGPNGVGKTTLLKLCNGLYHPTGGDVFLGGQNTKELRTSQIAKTVGFLFQNPDRQLFSDTIEKELAFGLRLKGLPGEQVKEQVRELMGRFGLEEGANPLTAGRSLRQITALASLVAIKPRLLLLDEPTTGLDHEACRRVIDIIGDLNERDGATVVMICHDMELVHNFARRVLVLCDGRLLADGGAGPILRDEALLSCASLAPPQALCLLNRLRDITRTEEIDTMEELVEYIVRRRSA